ncbi:MAG: phosphatase PAP2 family protein [Variovorax sp.]|nr:phosphatase PAP2 family protein [Variovorax sp.]|tara:strand:+ start:1385 stop:2005 length:621 start_codon:yes stop_codon:yes gene_type:complete
MLFAAWSTAVFLGSQLQDWDAHIHAMIVRRPHDVVYLAMDWVSRLHDTVPVLVYVTVLVVYLWRAGETRWAWVLCVAGPALLLMNTLLKHAFSRPRPSPLPGMEQLSSWSFPSGHTLGATAFYGFLVGFFWLRASAGSRTRWLMTLFAALAIVTVAVSRVMLGVHYLSDVVASIFEGCALVAAVLAALTCAESSAGDSLPEERTDQ